MATDCADLCLQWYHYVLLLLVSGSQASIRCEKKANILVTLEPVNQPKVESRGSLFLLPPHWWKQAAFAGAHGAGDPSARALSARKLSLMPVLP